MSITSSLLRWLSVWSFLAVSSAALATERVKVNPYIKAGPATTLNQLANGSPIAGFVPTKSNSDLLLEAEKKGWLGDTTKKTAVTVKGKVKVPVSGISTKFKNLVKTNPGQVAIGAATTAALAAVSWVMSDDNTKVQKKTETVDALPVSSKGQQFSAAVYLLFVTCLADAQ